MEKYTITVLEDNFVEAKKSGEFIKVKATIKKHEEYKDIKKTFLTRVR